MEKLDEYKWVSDLLKGESWDYAKSLLRKYNFKEIEGQHFKSPNTDVVYRFVLKRDGELFVTSIDILTDNIYTPIEYSVSDRINAIQKNEDEKNSEIEEEERIKKALVHFMKTNSKPFAEMLNGSEFSWCVDELKRFIGKRSDEPFFSLDFLTLELNGEERVCKIVKSKPNSIHRKIETPSGIYYAVPINESYEDIFDSILSAYKLYKLIGFEGVLDYYKEDK